MKEEHPKFICPMPISEIQHKAVHVTFTQDEGTNKETCIATVLIAEDSDGLSQVKLQIQKLIPEKKCMSYTSFYLNAHGINQLKKVDCDEYDYVLDDLIHLKK